MRLFRLEVSIIESSKRYLIGYQGKDENEVMAEFGINHSYLKVHSIKETFYY